MFLQEINQALLNKSLFLFFFFFLGACLGSFFNVVSFRYMTMIENENASDIKMWLEEKGLSIPEGIDKFIKKMNLSFPSSHCYSCGNSLKWYHNIPIFSFIFLRGACGFCKTRISFQYPLVEFLCGLTLASVYYFFFRDGAVLLLLLASFFFMVCFVLMVVDFRTMFLPDGLNYALLWVGLLASVFGITLMGVSLNESILAACIGFSVLWFFSFFGKLLKGVEVMGGGDLKLVAALGVFVGIPGVLFTIFASPFIGIVFWLYAKLSNSEHPQFPYGPSLIMTSWVYMFFGKQILKYLGIFI